VLVEGAVEGDELSATVGEGLRGRLEQIVLAVASAPQFVEKLSLVADFGGDPGVDEGEAFSRLGYFELLTPNVLMTSCTARSFQLDRLPQAQVPA